LMEAEPWRCMRRNTSARGEPSDCLGSRIMLLTLHFSGLRDAQAHSYHYAL
jgi:hypothetical protein